MQKSSPVAYENPMQTDGFEFVEFAAPTAGSDVNLRGLFQRMGFTAVAKHRSKNVTLFRQGSINFILNEEPNSFASQFADLHGPGACAMAFRVKDAKYAFERALSLGAEGFDSPIGEDELKIPAIIGIGGSLLYFVDRYTVSTIYDVDFVPLPGVDQSPVGLGLIEIDHLTHNVFQGRMDHWADFYIKLFNFREQRYFDISGAKTGLLSRAMIAPCSKIRIPINESRDDKSQIAEYLDLYKGEGIQHIALTTEKIIQSVNDMAVQNIPFMTVPKTYYKIVDERLPGNGLPLADLSQHHILIDGEIDGARKDLLLQIFTKTVIGPIFFEIIQRLGHQGFGEGNFTALFEALERDQMERGVLLMQHATKTRYNEFACRQGSGIGHTY